MRRLYFKIYMTVLGVGLLTVVAAGITAKLLMETPAVGPEMRRLVEYIARDLPEEPDAMSVALKDRGEALGLHLSMWDKDRKLMATHGPTLPGPTEDSPDGAFFHTGDGPGLLLKLESGCWVAGRSASHTHAKGLGRLAMTLGLIMLALAVGCFPIARRLTRRLEHLQRGVEELGAGDLKARVEVCGSDEVAGLAISFNAAADRIEALVGAQKRMMASASHELRSPLARLRMAVELLSDPENGDPGPTIDGAVKDIAELDALVGDLLLASRLEGGVQAADKTPVDVMALAVEEAARVDATVTGSPRTVSGDASALRRLMRNLLENALRHGAAPIEVTVTPLGDGARLVVADSGPGVPQALRERIFEPFYRAKGHNEGADGGVGLGLALVREIAHAHGGAARCVGGADGGSRFEVDLP